MPDLLASTSLHPLTRAIPLRVASVAVSAAADFMAMLGDLVVAPHGKAQGGKGQALAGDGKILPVEEGETACDPVIAWLPPGLVPFQPIEPAPLPATARVEAVPVAIAAEAAAAPAGDMGASILLPEAVDPMAGSISVDESVAAVDDALAPAALEIEADVTTGTRVREQLARPALAPKVIPQPVAPGAVSTLTAGQAFAAAISASFDLPAAPVARVAGVATGENYAAAVEQLRTTVQAMSGAEQAPLDLGRDDWPGKMVDRIAALRDAAEAADTRIRLAPENLGNVDVSIRRDGDRLHVHFAAENPATRQLLAEAAPRLAELADARGVKLGQASVDAGAGGQQGAPDQPQSNQPARPAPAIAHASETDRDDRVA